MSPATVERIHQAAEELGYVPNPSAAALRRGHSDVFLIARDPTFIGDVSERSNRALGNGLRSRGFVPLMHDMQTEADLISVVQAIRPAGALILGTASPQTQASLLASGAGHIYAALHSVDGGPPQRPWEDAIGRLQVKHLVERGVDRIVCLQPIKHPRAPVAAARLAGVRAECLDRALTEPIIITAQSEPRQLAEVISPVVDQAGITGIAAWDDRAGMAVLAAAHDRGWDVPKQVRVIGGDGQAETQFIRPRLTTVQYDDAAYAQWSRDIVELLFSVPAVDDAFVVHRLVNSVGLVIGDST
jgi:DNA-binding LacI/PurR family transcriptional regulator